MTPITTIGPRPCSHAGRRTPAIAQIRNPASGIENCMFCQKSTLVERTFMKCG